MSVKITTKQYVDNQLLNKLNFIKLTEQNMNDNYPDTHEMHKYSIGMFIDSNGVGYVGFYISWIVFQIKINTGESPKCRFKYGNSPWIDWYSIF